ncbi:MAG TPA: glycoside hydrolase family 127 protein, partial [Rubrobacter sp.]
MLDSTPPVVVDTTRSPHAKLRPLPIDDVRLSDNFWEPRRRINHDKTLPSQFEHIEETGRLDNFRRASGKIEAPFRGLYFNDSDVYKWLEAASWSLATHPDPELARMVDVAITEIEDAQRPDGYLNTYFTFERASERWTDFDLHEMYCAGHLFQAAVAHFYATGSERLLDIAVRFADHICDVFGPEEQGKRLAVDGHEEIEMALVELFRVTGDRRYLEEAMFFVDARGRRILGEPYGRFDPSYSQDHKPLREQDEVVGHAVRAMYFYSGAADVYAEIGDPALKETLERLWLSMTTRRMYVTGGLGSRYEGEAFGDDYELPNERAYTETCAAIGSVMWNWRMLMLDGDASYADLIEHTLYNAVLPGISLDGGHYFYQNPLAAGGTHRRQPWFGCACCPPNVARLLASLPGYFYGASEDAVWVHLYAEGETKVSLEGNRTVRLAQRTRYPWDGRVEISVDGEGEFALMLRIPSWCEEGASVNVNGEPVGRAICPCSYLEIRRAWRPGDTVSLHLPMPVRRVECHPYVAENNGRVALMRGPILYCVEQADNPNVD